MSALLIRLGLFLLPFIFFFLWLLLVRHLKRAGGKINPKLDYAIMGAGLGFIGLYGAIFYFYAQSTPPAQDDLRYVPARMVDGEMVPGHFEKRGTEPPQSPVAPQEN
ncbi:hypothetical protein JCM17846_12680 [Iodidimonas nitroreducens]|uniref:Uncharacterized protein n=1 Tax=Iodidimonas nitroreducens TaxID=1236968 RepID=A0A5A7N997_9PROT|nr:hypothetical protein [Iodidimonas nitroreducens]GAK33699.1 hypothetical protein AQ1_01589 [alpha proteobacterium Q-1]GER03586.1 hypothetical protein JCM17846_12680 [Iodidimonas nitroreducens]